MSAPHFTPKTVAFLQKLERNNNREWFRAHRDEYEIHVRQPMVDLVEHMELDLRGFAPELVATPRKSIYRIYRDTRFSTNKTPLKTQIAAIFPHRQLSKHGGAGLYLHISTESVLIGGGLYRPEQRQLQHLREFISANEQRLRDISQSKSFRNCYGSISGHQLKRTPRGFDPDHPAQDFLRLTQFLASTNRPVAFATRTRFYWSVLRLFKELAPLIQFLNEPLVRHEFQL